MPTVHITEKGCRGCTMCVDICPVDVFELENDIAKVVNQDDCIECRSCTYACPSGCIELPNTEAVRPFHRIEKNVHFVEKFLQTAPSSQELTPQECRKASEEVGLLLIAYSNAISEILGRGHRSAGRRAGTAAAAHMPEMYEQKDTASLLARMQQRFGASFDFTSQIGEDSITLSVSPCGLLGPLKKAALEPGKADLCLLFHEYWAGLMSSYTGKVYKSELKSAGDSCTFCLRAS
ncbi:MAG: 4Fe-4S dicluster domain-containing protein [Chitinivibrionales bacterium]|nr:4Fe-4S dicluster domain-containing protein [Chitinivibrionales bacterium]